MADISSFHTLADYELGDRYTKISGRVFTASDDLNRADNFARFGQFLHRMQMSKDSRIIHCPGPRGRTAWAEIVTTSPR